MRFRNFFCFLILSLILTGCGKKSESNDDISRTSINLKTITSINNMTFGIDEDLCSREITVNPYHCTRKLANFYFKNTETFDVPDEEMGCRYICDEELDISSPTALCDEENYMFTDGSSFVIYAASILNPRTDFYYFDSSTDVNELKDVVTDAIFDRYEYYIKDISIDKETFVKNEIDGGYIIYFYGTLKTQNNNEHKALFCLGEDNIVVNKECGQYIYITTLKDTYTEADKNLLISSFCIGNNNASSVLDEMSYNPVYMNLNCGRSFEVSVPVQTCFEVECIPDDKYPIEDEMQLKCIKKDFSNGYTEINGVCDGLGRTITITVINPYVMFETNDVNLVTYDRWVYNGPKKEIMDAEGRAWTTFKEDFDLGVPIVACTNIDGLLYMIEVTPNGRDSQFFLEKVVSGFKIDANSELKVLPPSYTAIYYALVNDAFAIPGAFPLSNIDSFEQLEAIVEPAPVVEPAPTEVPVDENGVPIEEPQTEQPQEDVSSPNTIVK